ncbi:MAG: polysaccharide biosynthesis C-terminal domain-containing protein, partial [Phenylobacterium sp.]|nr:polysaccharide biosynthesis C-terminal domain-containing protein [Phenylobacterium sp.]
MPDLTAGPIGPTLVTFALPVLGTNILQSLSGTSNAFWVSHVLGPAALTATTNANQVFFLMMGAMFGVSMSANLLIGQAIGSGNQELAKRVVGTCIIFFLAISLMVGLTGFLATPGILAAMGTPADARADATTYLRVIFMAIPIMYFFSFVQMAQRGTGDSRTPFYFALLAISMEVVLNPILITGFGPFPRMGIAGSASATLICQGLTLAAIIFWLHRRDSILIPRPGEFGYLIPDLSIIRTLVMKGLPMGLQMFIMSFAALTMTSF